MAMGMNTAVDRASWSMAMEVDMDGWMAAIMR